jgi:hypothetical protein
VLGLSISKSRFDRLNGVTPAEINAQFDYKPLSLWQSDINITDTLQSEYFDDILTKITASKTTALVYLTIYPIEGYDAVSDAAVAELAAKVKKTTEGHSKMFIRYASEMVGILLII